MRARNREIVHCDHCGGLIVGPQDYDVALCYCAKPKSNGKTVAGNDLRARDSARRRFATDPAAHEQPVRLEQPPATLAWDALPPHEK